MAHIPLSKGLFAIVDEQDVDLVMQHRWHAARNAKPGYEHYAVSGAGGANPTKFGRLYMHRLILGARHGQFVDHINGIGLDNRRANLRFATPSQNATNRYVPNSIGYRGVHRTVGGRYRAGITVNYRRYAKGNFDTAIEAARAYDELALAHHGEFAVLNFPRLRTTA